MIIVLTLPYCALLFVLIRLGILPNSKATWGTTGGWILLLLIFLFIPMQWGAPSGSARVMTRVVQIVPNVSGQVIEVAAEPNQPMQKGDVLFRLDPLPFQHSVDLAEATLVRVQTQSKQDIEVLEDAKANLRRTIAGAELAQSRYDDDAQLVESGVYSANRLEKRKSDLDQAQALVDSARTAVSRAEAEVGAVMPDGELAKVAEAIAQLDQARWNLEQTVVYAPGPGFATNVAVAAGQRAVSIPLAPTMAYVDTSEVMLIAQIHQIYLRHIKPGQPIEITMKRLPGLVFSGTVDQIVPAVSGGQAMVGGMVAPASQVLSEPFHVRINLDDPKLMAEFDPGSVGMVAIYTNSASATHIIRKVTVRLTAILNFINPAL